MESNLKVKSESFEDKLNQFKEKRTKIEDTLNEVCTIMKEIDGENDTWKGKTAKRVHDSYQTTELRFQDINAKLKSLETFLNQTLNSYKQEEEKEEKSINENISNLNINE